MPSIQLAFSALRPHIGRRIVAQGGLRGPGLSLRVQHSLL